MLRGPVGLRRVTLAALSLLSTSGCATTGATFRSGVGDTDLEHPPYYAGRHPVLGAGGIGHLPIAYQRGGAQPESFDPDPSGPMAELLARMNAHLDSLGRSVPLVGGAGASDVGRSAPGVPPDVRFGCSTESGFPDDDCEERDDGTALGRERQTMRLSVGRPSPEWIGWVGGAMTESGVEATLVVTLEVGNYLLRQRGLLGAKELELGTTHVQRLPWLTSLETPIGVLQLTGALVGRDGRALRIGAEGLLARRTRMALSAFDAQELVTDEDVERLLTARRENLPGRPLAWQAGLESLVSGLLGLGEEGRRTSALENAAFEAQAAPLAGFETVEEYARWMPTDVPDRMPDARSGMRRGR